MTKAGGSSCRKAPIACDAASEAISARMDGEQLPIASADLDAHLAGCPACRDFEAQVATLGRRVGLTAARPVPEGLVAALTAIAEPSDRRFAWMVGRRLLPGTRFGLSSRVQWAGAAVPAVLAAVALSMGAGSHLHLVPTRPPSACTAGLPVRHVSRGG